MLDDGAKERTVATSNLTNDLEGMKHVISFNDVAYHNEKFCDDSTVMMLALLSQLGYGGKVLLAGFDGFSGTTADFFDGMFEMTHSSIVDNEYVDSIIKSNYSSLNLEP